MYTNQSTELRDSGAIYSMCSTVWLAASLVAFSLGSRASLGEGGVAGGTSPSQSHR